MTEQFLKDIELIVTKSGYECVHVGIRSDFGRMKVQILIDSLGGINVDDCEEVSKRVNKFLDENSEIKDISIRKWKCPSCGTEHDRDVNAAINLREEGKRIATTTVGTTGSNAFGEA